MVLKIFQQLHFSSVFIFICLIETCHHINIYSNNDTVCSFLSHFRYCIVAMKVYKFLCTPSFCQCWSGAMCWFWFCFFQQQVWERSWSCNSAGRVSYLWTMWLSVAATKHHYYQGTFCQCWPVKHRPVNYSYKHLFNGLFSRTTWVCQYQKSETILDLNEAVVVDNLLRPLERQVVISCLI